MDNSQLRWRCRRGMKELDVLLERYFEQRLPRAAPAERQAFESLLELQDPDIYAWCLGAQAPPAEWAALIARITAPTAG